MTRSSLARIIRYGIRVGALVETDSPVAKAAFVRGLLRGLAR